MNETPSRCLKSALLPDDVDKVHRVFEQARKHTKLSRHDIKCERLAAMAIRFYQLGIHDEAELLVNVVNAHCKLNDRPAAFGGILTRP